MTSVVQRFLSGNVQCRVDHRRQIILREFVPAKYQLSEFFKQRKKDTRECKSGKKLLFLSVPEVPEFFVFIGIQRDVFSAVQISPKVTHPNVETSISEKVC